MYILHTMHTNVKRKIYCGRLILNENILETIKKIITIQMKCEKIDNKNVCIVKKKIRYIDISVLRMSKC